MLFSYRFVKRSVSLAQGKPMGTWGKVYMARHVTEALVRSAHHSNQRASRPATHRERVMDHEMRMRARRGY